MNTSSIKTHTVTINLDGETVTLILNDYAFEVIAGGRNYGTHSYNDVPAISSTLDALGLRDSERNIKRFMSMLALFCSE